MIKIKIDFIYNKKMKIIQDFKLYNLIFLLNLKNKKFSYDKTSIGILLRNKILI